MLCSLYSRHLKRYDNVILRISRICQPNSSCVCTTAILVGQTFDCLGCRQCSNKDDP